MARWKLQQLALAAKTSTIQGESGFYLQGGDSGVSFGNNAMQRGYFSFQLHLTKSHSLVIAVVVEILNPTKLVYLYQIT